MSIHSSLRTGNTTGQLRNVMKRHERIRSLVTKGQWEDGRSVFGLPKIKQTKVKARKAAGKEKEEAAATPATPGATPPVASS